MSASFSTAFPLACMGGWEILLILGGIVLGGIGMLFFTYWPYRKAMAALANGPLLGKPLALFATAMLGLVVWVGATWGGMALVLFAAGEFSFFFFVILGACGTILWFVLLIVWLSGRASPMGFTPSVAAPKLQVWFQDLLVAVLCYGAGLSILSLCFGVDRSRMDEFLGWAIYLLVVGSCGLFVAADLCRFSPACRKPLARALVFSAIFTLMPVAFLLVLPAWWRWKRLLPAVQMPKEKAA